MRGITKIFHSAAGEARVLKAVDLDIFQGQFVSIIGRSGSGKSTLVNMITGIDRPTSGTVEVGGRNTLAMPESKMAVWRGKNLGIVFQFFQLLPMLTLLENVMLPMDFCDIFPPASRESRAMALLKRVNLDKLAFSLPGAIAGGQQQCAAVARALANDPPILIADEPTGNLDSNTAEQVMGIFEELAGQEKTILMVTHDRTLAMRTKRQLIISDGELINEAISTVFPLAPHSLLLQTSQRASTVVVPPGTPLNLPSDSPDCICLVENGAMVSRVDDETIILEVGCLFEPISDRQKFHGGQDGAKIVCLTRSDVLELLPYAKQTSTDGGRDSLEPGISSQWFPRSTGGA